MQTIQSLTFLFTVVSTVNSGSHSLWIKATYIRGRTPFPEYSGYTILDDIVFGYYDSNERKILHKDINKASNSSFDEHDIYYGEHFIGLFSQLMKNRASYLNNYFNHTNDTHTFQRAAGCELLDNDEPGLMITTDAYNGETVQDLYYNAHHDAAHFNQKWTDSALWTPEFCSDSLCKFIYRPTCIKLLKKHLAKERNRVLKKVKPRVRLLQRTLPDSGGAKVTCLATGFYPRHINLTLLRDGQPVSDHQITGGELLPNGDETYQMRKSLEVSAEELQHHHYTCTAEHLSLDNKLDFDLERDGDSGTPLIASSALGAVLAVCCLVGVGIGVFIRWRRKYSDQGSQATLSTSYTAASNEDSQIRAASSADDSEAVEVTTPLATSSL
ncbi:major histocompatibility complex class I-related protein 1-like [Alosa pseudoharengus]|uniref:major histocompatibility complex class I-related protein 1-like n=1 Tax=Alosa pseudoharengus TaxID=34774 RepID=UPI003F88917A